MDSINIHWQYRTLLLFSLFLGIYLFFLNPELSVAFSGDEKNIEWYAVFSRNIFQPTTTYIAESVLLPLFAKFVGASTSTQSYRVLCSLITIAILPFLATNAVRFFQSITKAYLFVIVFGLSFTYLSQYRLGFPDPLTIVFLSYTALQRQPLGLFLGSFLAGLSHFSMSVVALAALCLILMMLPGTTREIRIKFLKFIVLGLLTSRLLLTLWFYLFEYHLASRTDFVLASGIQLFMNNYSQSPSGFWLTPGIVFLACYSVMISYFLTQKHFMFSLSLICALCLAYIAHFFTVDGLRVFAVVISSAYTLILATWINSLAIKFEDILRDCNVHAQRAVKLFSSQMMYVGVGFPITTAWLFFIGSSATKGLFINELSLLHIRILNIRLLDYGLVSCGIFIFFAMAVPKLRSSSLSTTLAKFIFFSPLFIISIQYLRQFAEATIQMSVELKIGLVIISLGLAGLSAQINFSRLFNRLSARLLA